MESFDVPVVLILGGSEKNTDFSEVLPDLKTAPEQGYDINCASLSAFEFPKGTPEAVVNRLAEATNKVVETAFVRDRFHTLGVIPSLALAVS